MSKEEVQGSLQRTDNCRYLYLLHGMTPAVSLGQGSSRSRPHVQGISGLMGAEKEAEAACAASEGLVAETFGAPIWYLYLGSTGNRQTAPEPVRRASGGALQRAFPSGFWGSATGRERLCHQSTGCGLVVAPSTKYEHQLEIVRTRTPYKIQ